MVSCKQLNEISSRLSKAFDRNNVSWGGESVILYEDFDQLPPVDNWAPLYSGNIGNRKNDILGKAMWYQFTDIIILRKNTR